MGQRQDSERSNLLAPEESPLVVDRRLHVWHHKFLSWITLNEAVQILSKATKTPYSKFRLRNHQKQIDADDGSKRDQMTDNIIYQTMKDIFQITYNILMPHELLVLILLYSQGYRFEIGDDVLAFAHGMSDGYGAFKGRVTGIIEDDIQNEQYYQIKRRDGDRRDYSVPIDQVFALKLVLIDANKWNEEHNLKLKEGAVLDIHKMTVESKQINSKKGQEVIIKSKDVVMVTVTNPTKYSYYNFSNERLKFEFDTSMFAEAKIMDNK